ncbi:hypothetical protein U1Q18_006825 [Sarracenia purpurea var. burkii]
MEAELELKKQATEEAKAKEDELNASDEKESGSDPEELWKVKMRLEKLEEAVKEIVVESKKQLGSHPLPINHDDGSDKRRQTATDHSNITPSRSEASNSAAKDQENSSGLAAPVIGASGPDLKGIKNEEPSKK